ncbi:MAG: alpha-glucan family phosphorylase [Sulfuriflexus sp.]|nr:alpha-glucan family phosphorylase [Sulfuriflexus sp.]
MSGTRFSLEVQARIPERLERLKELSNDLLYSWDREARNLFYRLDNKLWESSGHNPKVFLRRINQEKLNHASEDRVFMQDFNRVLSSYDSYMEENTNSAVNDYLDPEKDLVAYFCAEFGLHESFPIYSGGLGILAGDHCKAASDLNVPFIAIGLLYRQGYFTQTIDGQGQQQAHYHTTDFNDLPVKPATDEHGNEIHIHIDLPGRNLEVKVWYARAGHISLYLLDTDLPSNSEEDRAITYQLYGGDIHTRIQQEIVLGIGGIRAIRALGLEPTVWHINEGHAAFMIVERCREHVASGMKFDSALEIAAAGTVFTTHTPVPAGHDIFKHDMFIKYFAAFSKQLGISMEKFLKLGASPLHAKGFNQTALALRGSRYHNGVSRIHGRVASGMEEYIWPDIPETENPMRHVTNGVHVQTFLAREWVGLFDMRFGGGWRNELLNEKFWEQIDDIPDQTFWSLRQTLKTTMLKDVRARVLHQHQRNGSSALQLERNIQFLEPARNDILTIGFARRFATYKRAALLFANPERLEKLLNDQDRPVVFVFAGKAHPKDEPGQELIRTIYEFSQRPEYSGKIIMVEGYDMSLARKLVSGVDVWLNTPEYPLEASGTSGEKAGINGVINLSVLDGWWGEGYNGENGWAISPHEPEFDSHYRYHEEANELLDILEKMVIPSYYQRDGHGYSEEWVHMSKASMKSLMPRYNSQRMVMDYVRDFYSPASKQCPLIKSDNHHLADELAKWKNHIQACWDGVTIRRLDENESAIRSGETLTIELAMNLNGLNVGDIIVECLVSADAESDEVHETLRFHANRNIDSGETLYRLEFNPSLSGMQYYRIRTYPWHEHLCHRFETGRMLWL